MTDINNTSEPTKHLREPRPSQAPDFFQESKILFPRNTHTCTYILSYAHSNTHTYTQYIYTHTHTNTHIHMHTDIHIRLHTFIYIYSHRHIHTCACTHKHVRTFTDTRVFDIKCPRPSQEARISDVNTKMAHLTKPPPLYPTHPLPLCILLRSRIQ